jgi:malate dehydrogenase
VGFIAIVGGGALGGALAHTLAVRDRAREVRLVDGAGTPPGSIARGKALDILQSSPVDGFSARVTAAESVESAVGADVVVLADSAANTGEHTGENGLAMLRHLQRAGSRAPIVFAGTAQTELMARAITELHMPRAHVLGSAPFALESALRAMVGLSIDGSAVEVCLRVVGVPPRHAVVAWEESSAFGQPLSSQMPAHAIAGLSARIPGLWPPGPYALASAAARIVEGIAFGSRRRFSCFVAKEAGPIRAAVASMPVEVGPQGVIRILEPALTRQERTWMENAVERQTSG